MVVADLQLSGADGGAGRAAALGHVGPAYVEAIEMAGQLAGARADHHRALLVVTRQADPGDIVEILPGCRFAGGQEYFMLGSGPDQDARHIGDRRQGPIEPLDLGRDAARLHELFPFKEKSYYHKFYSW